jgi:UDP-N-acetylglucosamine pyrophosphorylase
MMTRPEDLGPKILKSLEENRIDTALSLEILNGWNSGKYKDTRPIVVRGIPSPEDMRILDIPQLKEFHISADTARKNLHPLLPEIDLSEFGRKVGPELIIPRRNLETLGVLLYPFLSCGVLNGGSATSYGDTKKNRGVSEALYQLLEPAFLRAAELCRDRPKGITPAYTNPDGSPGYSFLELKMRNLLLEALRYRRVAAKHLPKRTSRGKGFPEPLTPMFQMTSLFTDSAVAEAFREYRNSPLLAGLIEELGIDITRVETGVQPLIAAFTHSSEGPVKRIFSRAGGVEGRTLGLPGGHGQNFLVLRDVYRCLYDGGKRFVYLGNVDNLGFTPDPAALAVLALSGKQAGFEFSFRTSVDVKGGILVIDDRDRLTCADIGPAVSPEEVEKAEAEGKRVLFNVATGLFDLKYLAGNLDRIIDTLPTRWSDQDKDSGKYSQAEQVTWEVVGLLDEVLIFGVDKYRRFLAAKLLIEGLLTGGAGLDNPDFPSDPDPAKDFKSLGKNLHEGFCWNMENRYGMKPMQGRWEPVP